MAKLAIAHELAVRLYRTLRTGEDYQQIKERSSHAGSPPLPPVQFLAEKVIGRPASVGPHHTAPAEQHTDHTHDRFRRLGYF